MLRWRKKKMRERGKADYKLTTDLDTRTNNLYEGDRWGPALIVKS